MNIKSLTIYCSSSDLLEEKYYIIAEKIGFFLSKDPTKLSLIDDVYRKYKNLHHQTQNQSVQTALVSADINILAMIEYSNQQNVATPNPGEI